MGAGDSTLHGAEFKKVPRLRRIRCGRNPDANCIGSCGPIPGDVERLVGVSEDVSVGEEGAVLGRGVIEVGFLLGCTVDPVTAALLLRVDGVGITKFLWRRGARNPGPLAVKVIGRLAFLFGLDGRYNRGVFGALRRYINGRCPCHVSLVAIHPTGITFGNFRCSLSFGFDVEFKFGGRTIKTDEVFIDGLAAKGEILFKLIGRHEQGRAHGIKSAGTIIRGEFGDGDFHAQEFTEGIFIFAPVESTHGELSTVIADGLPGRHHGVREHF